MRVERNADGGESPQALNRLFIWANQNPWYHVRMNIQVGKYQVLVDNDFVLKQGQRIEIRPDRKGEPRAYVVNRKENYKLPLARYVLGLVNMKMPMTPESLVVDHINCGTLDNRKENLRICTARENIWRQRTKNGKDRNIRRQGESWQATLYFNKKVYSFTNRDERLVREWLTKLRHTLHGEYAFDA